MSANLSWNEISCDNFRISITHTQFTGWWNLIFIHNVFGHEGLVSSQLVHYNIQSSLRSARFTDTYFSAIYIQQKHKRPCITLYLYKYNIHSVYYLLFQRAICTCKASEVCQVANNTQNKMHFEYKFSVTCQILNDIGSYTFTFREAHGWMRQNR
jgi:hypothetical protein